MTEHEYAKIYDLYIRCFPEYPVKKELFMSLLEPEKAVIFTEYDGEKLTGFSMIHSNSIALLCVDDIRRRKGIGGKLLAKSEEYIQNTNAEKIILGRGSRYLLQGVPDDKYSSVDFFRKRGYTAGWTSVNMSLPLADFNAEKPDIPPCPDYVNFRFTTEADLSALLIAVSDAKPDWLDIFKTCADPVFIAEYEGKILGFEILSPDGGRFVSGKEKAGCVGCVGVINEAREKGIGRQMVVRGIEWLKGRGCTSIELRYVHLVDWYKKIGFEVIRHQWMGEKKI